MKRLNKHLNRSRNNAGKKNADIAPCPPSLTHRFVSISKHELFRLMSGVFFVFAAFFIVCAAFLSVSVIVAIKAFLTQYFGIFLPGVVLNILLCQKKQRPIEFIIISYALGYLATLICYFLFVPWDGQACAPIVMSVCAIASLVLFYKLKSQIQLDSFEKSDLLFFSIFTFYMILLFFSYSANLISPVQLGEAVYVNDHMFWIENAAALTRGFPAIEPRVDIGEIIYYHHFSAIYLAWISLSSSIDLFSLGGTLYTLTKGLLLFGAVYLIAIKFCRSTCFRIVAISSLLFCTGIEKTFYHTFVAHTYIAPFGLDVALSFAGFFIYFFSQQCDLPVFNKKLFFLTVMCFISCVGLKGPVGAVMLVLAGCVCAFWLFQKKYKLAFLYGIGLLGAFLLVAVGMEGLLLMSGHGGTGTFSADKFLTRSSALSAFSAGLGADTWHWLIRVAFFGILTTVLSHPIIIGLFCCGLFAMLICRKMRTPLSFGLALSGLIGLALGLFNRQGSYSEMYFPMAAFLPCLCLGLIFIEKFCLGSTEKKRFLVAVSSILVLSQSALTFDTAYTQYGTGLAGALKRGWSNLTTTLSAHNSEGYSPETIYASDYEAMCWIRDNTPKDSVIMTDLVTIKNYRFYYGAFCERQIYLESNPGFFIYFRQSHLDEIEKMLVLLENVYSNSPNALQQAIDEGVNYIVQTKAITPGFDPDPTLAELVFSVNSIKVYCLNPRT